MSARVASSSGKNKGQVTNSCNLWRQNNYVLILFPLLYTVEAGYIQVGYIKIRIYQNDFFPRQKSSFVSLKMCRIYQIRITIYQIPLISKQFFFPNWQLTSDISISCPVFVIHAFENGDLSLTFTARDGEIASRGQGVWHRQVKFKLFSSRCRNDNGKKPSFYIHVHVSIQYI